MAKYEIVDIDRVDQDKPIKITMPFSEMKRTIKSLTKWQAIQLVYGMIAFIYNEDYKDAGQEHKRKFYRTLENKSRGVLEKILLSKLYIEGTITRA